MAAVVRAPVGVAGGGGLCVLFTCDACCGCLHRRPCCLLPCLPVPVLVLVQTRTVRIFHDMTFFAVGSIEGRVAIRCIDGALDDE